MEERDNYSKEVILELVLGAKPEVLSILEEDIAKRVRDKKKENEKRIKENEKRIKENEKRIEEKEKNKEELQKKIEEKEKEVLQKIFGRKEKIGEMDDSRLYDILMQILKKKNVEVAKFCFENATVKDRIRQWGYGPKSVTMQGAEKETFTKIMKICSEDEKYSQQLYQIDGFKTWIALLLKASPNFEKFCSDEFGQAKKELETTNNKDAKIENSKSLEEQSMKQGYCAYL